MRHAFMIMAHNNWNQLRTLLSLLDDERNSIDVHIDARSKDFDASKFNGVLKHASLTFAPRVKVTWGGSSQIQCELALLRRAVACECDYYHLLSGADLPLHDMDYIDDFFKSHRGQEFVDFCEIGSDMLQSTRERVSLFHPFQNMLGRNCRYVEWLSKRFQRSMGVDRLKEHAEVLAKGAQWYSITHGFALWVVDQWAAYRRLFQYSWCADELFMQTMLMNSPFRENIWHPQADDDYRSIMRLIDWKRGNPYVFHSSDYNELITSPMLFARKFDERVDEGIIEDLARNIRGYSL